MKISGKRTGCFWGMVVCLLFACCQNDDVDELRRDLNSQAERLAALEAWQAGVNRNIGTLQALVDALKNSKHIVSVTETYDGYTLVLNDNSVLKIYHGAAGKDGQNGTDGENGKDGEDGKDGKVVVPAVSVRDSSDGHTYWTVDGVLLRNAAGKAVRADGEKGDNGEQGVAGKEGVTPQLRINPQTNEWEISIDKGITWTTTGVKATGSKGDKGEQGEQGEAGSAGSDGVNGADGADGPAGPRGDAVFAEDGVDVQEDYVEFTLADGLTKIRVPRYRAWSLKFPRGMSAVMPPGVRKIIPFTIEGKGGKPSVNVLGNGGWQAEIRMDVLRADSGVVVVTAPPMPDKAAVVVVLNDGMGGCWTYRLSLKVQPTGEMIFVKGGSLSIVSPTGDGWRLTDYWLGKTEVTCRQYCDFLNDQHPVPTPEDLRAMGDTIWYMWPAFWHNDSLLVYRQGKWQPGMRGVYYTSGIRVESMADYPAMCVTWYGARAYCRWAGGSLPTEAQWDYAARGGEGNPDARTQKYAGSDNPDEVGWFDINCSSDGSNRLQKNKGCHPVGMKAPNFLGFYDMSGNVEEWCRDLSDWGMGEYPSNGLDGKTDPQGPEKGYETWLGTYWVLRGGFWQYCNEIGRRFWEIPLNSEAGFRLAYKPE